MMKTRLLIVALALISSFTNAQDTTWVQTFTFDSISTRRGDFTFPPELDTMRFEKVLMYYKLKCDPLTPWDSYNCGEWDYLTYTRVFDHTGQMDSVQVDSVRYMNNFNSFGTYDYDTWPYTYQNTYAVSERYRTPEAITYGSFPQTLFTNSNMPFDLTNKGSRYQMVVTAAELASAGVMPGDIQSLTLYITTLTGSGDLMHPVISMKHTNQASITAFDDAGFTEVYNISKNGVNAPQLVNATNEFFFYQPFNWNGTDNVLIEFTFDNGVMPTSYVEFRTETSAPDMAVGYSSKNGVMSFDGSQYAALELSDINLGDDVTIAFWAKGLGNTGVNTSILEGYDTLNQRVINIHMPWSNNRIYWDCGEGNGYDRIDQDMTGAGIDNEWHHWAFIKDQSTGEMKIMRDGVLWHSGTGFTLPVGYLHRLVIGSNRSISNHWTGKIDEFQLYDVAVDEATIAAWYQNKIDASHPNWNNLLVYYDFDNEEYAIDKSQNDYLLMPSAQGMFDFNEFPLAGLEQSMNRPLIEFGTGTVTSPTEVALVDKLDLVEPEVVFEYAPVDRHFEIVNAFVAVPEGSEDVYDAFGALVSSTPFTTSNTLTNETITYYEEPFEIIHDVEIGRFITPYGIQFDLGPNGFTWIYDVTDYQMYLNGVVDLAAHNTQELIDLRFAFIEGVPPRDVIKREPIWSDWRSYRYDNMDNDVDLQAVQVALSDSAEMFKIKTRFTGHGHHGNVNCCEWDSKDHEILVDGVSRFNWEIWEETACGDNPNVSQGGTWPYAREGWCPGDLVKEYDHELTPYVTPGTTVTFDYDIENIPANDQAQGSGNYIVAMDLISYGAPNFQHDAAIVDIYNPNSWEYYSKWNPSCQNPRVIIQNTGEQPLTSARVSVWIDYNNKVSFDWTGNLEFLEKEVVEIPIPDVSFWYDYGGSGTFTAHIDYLNSTWYLDEYQQNDEKTVAFEAPEQINWPGLTYQGFLVWFNTNNKAHENQWRMMDSQGNTIFERTNLQNSTDYKDTFDLAPGCYSIILEDNDNDGISFWYSQQVEGETSGSFRVKLVGGPVVEVFQSDFGNFHQYNFTIGFNLEDAELKEIEDQLIVYPNPNNGLFDLELLGNVGAEANVQVFDLMGRQVYSGAMNANATTANASIDLSNVPSGHYIVKVTTPNNVHTTEFIKK
jgi:hypothetical protein